MDQQVKTALHSHTENNHGMPTRNHGEEDTKLAGIEIRCCWRT